MRITKHVETVGGISLRRHDLRTPGLQIGCDWRGVATLRLTNARRRNPLTKGLLEGLHAFLRSCADAPVEDDEQDPHAVRCILIEGDGPVHATSK